MYKCVWQRETENGFVTYIVSTEISENRFSLLYIESVQNIHCELCDKIFVFVSFRIFAVFREVLRVFLVQFCGMNFIMQLLFSRYGIVMYTEAL